MRLKAALVLSAALALAACSAEVGPSKVEVKAAPIKVQVGDQPAFCPPGQAKHGRC